ncbi:mitochondrial alternative oxidase form 2 (AOX2) [Andalucia godoyi]|uniref:Mitochondrial alternative oxidase form 2 (AOX2) n=1 Tax=Andalucia godoyi TaxID=505711 RepID=A0A8K0AI67_ANDGO|nr:mitochondrial alternative oxidase form 2 (AOX2) [Andalucia godoyi]|eukprot:ANDGO_02028.mRNA.1 mitochondrial alternative oxidase form 2 (AOX2)
MFQSSSMLVSKAVYSASLVNRAAMVAAPNRLQAAQLLSRNSFSRMIHTTAQVISDGTKVPFHDAYVTKYTGPIHYEPKTLSDKIAFMGVKALRVPIDMFFAKRYGSRAVVIETVASVPGFVAGMLQHLSCLRRNGDDHGWINKLLDEAENERMHLMTFMHVAKPNILERAFVITAQAVFFNAYFWMYLLSPKTAHRFVGYLEEEACTSYTAYLKQLENGEIPNPPAPEIARVYWNLPADATLKDVVRVVRDDEAEHRTINHGLSDELVNKKPLQQS